MDHSPPGSSVHGILDTGMGCHALLSGVLPSPGIKPVPLTSPARADGFFISRANSYVCTLYIHTTVCM